jgi:nitrogen regulatory protein PII
MMILMVVFRNSMEDDVLSLLRSSGVDAFTDLPKVFGVGEAGSAFSSFEWPGSNAMILAALQDEEVEPVVDALRAFRDRLTRAQHGAKVPLRAFVVPCAQAI